MLNNHNTKCIVAGILLGTLLGYSLVIPQRKGSDGVSLRDAMRFHTYLKRVIPPSDMAVSIHGFNPSLRGIQEDWLPPGTPGIGISDYNEYRKNLKTLPLPDPRNVAVWTISRPKDRQSDLMVMVLMVRLVPRGKSCDKLFTWENYDVEIIKCASDPSAQSLCDALRREGLKGHI